MVIWKASVSFRLTGTVFFFFKTLLVSYIKRSSKGNRVRLSYTVKDLSYFFDCEKPSCLR